MATLTVAAANIHGRWLDPGGTTEVVVETLQEAAAEGVDLVAFGETFLSGYPHWLGRTGGAAFDDPLQKRAYAAYLDAAVEVDGPHVGRVVEACNDLGCSPTWASPNGRPAPAGRCSPRSWRSTRGRASSAHTASCDRPTKNGSCGDRVMATACACTSSTGSASAG